MGGTGTKGVRSTVAMKLLGFALFWAVAMYLLLMPKSSSTHWNWNRRVQVPVEVIAPRFKDDAPVAHPLPPRPTTTGVDRLNGTKRDPFALVNGVDYFSDYDVAKTSQVPESYPGEQKFRYMDKATSKWPFIWVSARPRVAYVPDFLTDEECDAIIASAQPSMDRSRVVPHHGGNAVDEVRTSSQTWLSVTSGVGGEVANKIYELISFPPGSSEMLQVLRYEKSQKYDAHLDYFDPAMYGPQTSNRAVTVYLYLTDVADGGHTWFPDADGKTLEVMDYKSCKRGFGFKPHKRTAVVFYDMKPNGDYDPWSLHGSCPVKEGVKWGGTLWFRIPTTK